MARIMDVMGMLHGIRYEDLPVEVVAQAKACLLDLLGTAAGGSRMPLSGIIRDHAVSFFAAGGKEKARILLDGRTASPAGAALSGAMTIDALDCHDGQALTKGHVGCALLPSLLAYYDAGATARSGREMLADLVLGYEIGTRMGIALHATAPDYHTSGAWNAVTCAALGARVMGLDREQTRQALGIAEYHGPRSQMMRVIDHPSMLKDGSGWGAMAGVSAAFLARAGFTGAPAILLEREEVAEIWRDLGERWYILEQYFKPYPVCRWAQPSIAAGLQLRTEYGFTAGDIEKVSAVTFHQGRRLFQGLPETTEEAQYAITFPLAAALVHGHIGPEEISGAGLKAQDVLDLCARIHIDEADRYNALFPAERWAHVEIQLKDGRCLTSAPAKADGDPDSPLAPGILAAKYRRLAVPVLGQARAQALSDLIDGLEEATALNLLNLAMAPED